MALSVVLENLGITGEDPNRTSPVGVGASHPLFSETGDDAEPVRRGAVLADLPFAFDPRIIRFV